MLIALPPPLPPLSPTKKGFSMLGSLVSSKKKTLNDINNFLDPNSQPISSSVTLDQESTSNIKDCKPYWNNYTKALSERL
ncbi:hypothetical protein C1645_749510 [Glomus cerebriforme]|uniref:Uncharacterized protein n=1 Tax=Glomus cerebriforme TaxID=658196 RepID=A0A397TJV3_9GLOM|nr:hypothetical protein C1645_749510 [Glomus cerebriforme]